MIIPPDEVTQAINGGRITSLRRAEIYETDGETRWLPAGADEPVSRLESGAISVDATRDERRSLDISLDNDDNALRPDSENGLWYDKVIKCFRGVRYGVDPSPPAVAIVYEDSAGQGDALKAIIQQLGFTNVDLKLSATTVEELSGYEIIVSHGRVTAAGKASLMASLYAQGKKVLTTGNGSTPSDVPLLVTVSSPASVTWGITPPAYSTPVAGGWATESEGADTGVTVTAVRATASVVATYLDGATTHYTGVLEENVGTGGKWFHYQPHAFGTQAKLLLKNALGWLWGYTPYKTWETQVGEFCIDNIAESNFPFLTKITGRDYTKRCLTSKIETSMSFASGTPIELIVTSLGANAGITKFNVPITGQVTGSRLDFDRGTERWKIMQAAANSSNYDLFFDPFGFLTMQEFRDPSFSAVAQTFMTGPESGNLVSWDRSANDSRVYNHIVVTGEQSSDSGLLPFFGEAINDEPSSPTRKSRIGDRPYFFTSSFFTSNQQCIDLAHAWLKLHALESYEINFSSLLYPWLEAGEIIEFLEPRRRSTEPTRFLMDTLSIPMGLGAMSATGKRVTFVQDSTLAA